LTRLVDPAIPLLEIALVGCRGEPAPAPDERTEVIPTASVDTSFTPPVYPTISDDDHDEMIKHQPPPGAGRHTSTPPPGPVGPPPPTPDPAPVSDSAGGQRSAYEVVASVPVGDDGVHYERGPKTWGPQAFAVAPDGAFWIADTVGDRLLRFTAQDEPLQVVDLNGVVTLPYDLAIASDRVWVLGRGKLPGPALLTTDGRLLATYGLRSSSDAELMRGSPGEASSVLLRVGTKTQLWWLIDPSDPDKGARYDFVDVMSHDGRRLPHKNDDGTSYVVVNDMDPLSPVIHIHQTVRHIGPDADVLGVAQTHLADLLMPVHNRLKVGPDGAVYELVTKDAVVEIVRLPFWRP
jgi:hypothetical protein